MISLFSWPYPFQPQEPSPPSQTLPKKRRTTTRCPYNKWMVCNCCAYVRCCLDSVFVWGFSVWIEIDLVYVGDRTWHGFKVGVGKDLVLDIDQRNSCRSTLQTYPKNSSTLYSSERIGERNRYRSTISHAYPKNSLLYLSIWNNISVKEVGIDRPNHIPTSN